MNGDRLKPERLFPIFGIVLLAETAVSALPPMATLAVKGTASFPGVTWLLFVLGHLVFPGVLGALVVAIHRRTTGHTAFLQWASLVAVAGQELTLAGWNYLGTPRTLALCEPLSSLLVSFALPVLWGSAVARLRHPGNGPLQATGRKAAGLLQLSFTLRFAARFQFLGSIGSLNAVNAGTIVWSLVEVMESLILLWASVEAVRTTPDEDAVRERATRIHNLLGVWFVLLFIGSAATNVLYLLGESVLGLVYQLLTLATSLTLTVTAAAAVARHCSARIGGVQFPASDPLTGRSGGVESTGEPS
jgi:hypothetical protein